MKHDDGPKRDTPDLHGRWTFSADPDHWSCEPTFATKAEAETAAKAAGQWNYVGRCVRVEWPSGFYDCGLDLENAEEAMEAGSEDPLIEPNGKQTREIEAAVEKAIKDTLERHGLWPVAWWKIEDMYEVRP